MLFSHKKKKKKNKEKSGPNFDCEIIGGPSCIKNLTNHVTKIAFSLEQNRFYNGNI